MSIDVKKINSFFNRITEEEYYYIKFNLQVSDYARSLIKEFNLSKEEFCKIVDIPAERYKSYINGGTNKEFLDIAKMQSAKTKLSFERVADEVRAEMKFEAKS